MDNEIKQRLDKRLLRLKKIRALNPINRNKMEDLTKLRLDQLDELIGV